VAKDPINCYLEGTIEHLNLPVLLGKFANALTQPQSVKDFLAKNGVDFKKLALQLVPKEMFDVTGTKLLQRRIYFEGAIALGKYIVRSICGHATDHFQW
jgi:hypothetical protein